MKYPSIVISLVVFDGDDTLWYGLDGGYISGTDWFDQGREDYTFSTLDDRTILRNDGRRFRLFPEVPNLLLELKQRNVLISLASYNHPEPVFSALRGFMIGDFFVHAVAEWSSQKDRMIKSIISSFQKDGFLVRPETSLFIDDDLIGRYRKQMERANIHFLQKDVDIQDLREILNHPRFTLVPPQASLMGRTS